MKKGLVLVSGLFIGIAGLAAQFQDVPLSIPAFSAGSFTWGDYDNDGDLDVLISGQIPTHVYTTRIYRNDGVNGFVDINAGFPGMDSSSTDWGDFDNDGDLDFVISGATQTPSGRYTRIYRNDGAGVFTEINVGLAGVMTGSVKWGDYDNDGYLDLLINGVPAAGPYVTKLYRNNRNSTFSEITTNIPGFRDASIDWGDYDNEGDLDVLMSGINTNGSISTEIYRNDGDGVFVPLDTNLTDIKEGVCSWGDFDNDGDLDVLLTGNTGNMAYNYSRVFRNMGNDLFTDIQASLTDIGKASSCWGDHNNDGYLDIFMAGWDEVEDETFTRVYQNVANLGFFDIGDIFVETDGGDSEWGDYDNDGDLDIMYFGGVSGGDIIKLYKNIAVNPNTIPNMPTDLHISISGDYVYFHWNPATDSQTASPGLSYTLRIGTTPESCDLLSPMASSSGTRLKPIRGFANTNFWKIKRSALPDVFYWSVQAVDTSFKGSAFSPIHEVSFLPMITLLSPASMQFGQVPVQGNSSWAEITVKNTSYTQLVIDSVTFSSDETSFSLNYPSFGMPVESGANASMFVRFSPSSVGTIIDTLYIHSSAVNMPMMKIRLAGMGIQAPPMAPENLSISMDTHDVILSWDEVIQTIFNTPVSPDYYLIFNSSNPAGSFTFYGATSGLCYTCPLVGLFAPRMFYKIKAILMNDRYVKDFSTLGIVPGMREEDVFMILDSLVAEVKK